MAALGYVVILLAVTLEPGLGKKVKVSWKECDIAIPDRLNCGYNGIREEKCYQRGCCWSEEQVSGEPMCYHSITTTTPQCMVENQARVACGKPGVKKHHCLGQGCCWQPANDYRTPWCYETKEISVYPEECGVPAIRPMTGSRIVGGVDAKPHSWPWQVSLQLSGSHFCGASIINQYWIVSAAHCGSAWSWGDVTAVVGLYNKEEPESTAQSLRTATTYQHEEYDYDQGTNNLSDDIMLIQLEEPIQFNDHVSPICIPDQGEQSFEDDMICYVTGWGTVELFGYTPAKLQQVSVPIVNQETCTEWYEDPQNWYDESGNAPAITPEMICAGYEEGGRGSCHGDSGGPLVCQIGNQWKLAGVVSWGGPCAHERTPSVFARVSEYHDWIEDIITTHATK